MKIVIELFETLNNMSEMFREIPNVVAIRSSQDSKINFGNFFEKRSFTLRNLDTLNVRKEPFECTGVGN